MARLAGLELEIPIIQAPMAGVSTPQLAIAVSKAGGLGSLGLGASTPDRAAAMMAAVRAGTDRPFQANFFTHQPPRRDDRCEADWLAFLRGSFEMLGAEPPTKLEAIYPSFTGSEALMQPVLEAGPELVSFHFGLPHDDQVRALKARGLTLMATATCVEEAKAAERAGMDLVVAQGFEAGGHRGMFDPEAEDERLGMEALTRALVAWGGLPVVAAGGIMDGAGVKQALDLGAVAVQMGTAFIACPESAADEAYRAALFSEAARQTVMTRVISGRPARCLSNRFTALEPVAPRVPDYPVAYDAGKALNAAAKAAGEGGYGAQWAGQGAALARPMPAADLMRGLAEALAQA